MERLQRKFASIHSTLSQQPAPKQREAPGSPRIAAKLAPGTQLGWQQLQGVWPLCEGSATRLPSCMHCQSTSLCVPNPLYVVSTSSGYSIMAIGALARARDALHLHMPQDAGS